LSPCFTRPYRRGEPDFYSPVFPRRPDSSVVRTSIDDDARGRTRFATGVIVFADKRTLEQRRHVISPQRRSRVVDDSDNGVREVFIRIQRVPVTENRFCLTIIVQNGVMGTVVRVCVFFHNFKSIFTNIIGKNER